MIYWGFDVSADGTKLYATPIYQAPGSNTSYLFQYDLNASNILASVDTLATFTKPAVAGLVQRGPDDKIYLSCHYFVSDCDFDYLYCDTTHSIVTDNISVVNFPDSLGTACNFQPFSFNLGGHKAYYGLPNNPNYELKADSGSICDTVHVGLQELFSATSNLFVYYNPEWKIAFINANKLKGNNYHLILYDITGREIFHESGTLDSSPNKTRDFTRDLQMNGYADGMYLISLFTEKEKLVKKFLKQ